MSERVGSMNSASRLQVVGQEEVPDQPTPSAALALMIPVTALVTGFVLASQIVAEPSHNQIGLLAVYAVFSLALVSILRRKA
jgi:hypothetical protein